MLSKEGRKEGKITSKTSHRERTKSGEKIPRGCNQKMNTSRLYISAQGFDMESFWNTQLMLEH
jgi:hypothetical protein